MLPASSGSPSAEVAIIQQEELLEPSIILRLSPRSALHRLGRMRSRRVESSKAHVGQGRAEARFPWRQEDA